MVDKIDGNIFYVGRASYSVDRKYAEDVHQTSIKVEQSNAQDVDFIRLYRSLIINANYVDCIGSKAIAIGNHVFPVPKAHRHLIAEYFLLFQRKKE